MSRNAFPDCEETYNRNEELREIAREERKDQTIANLRHDNAVLKNCLFQAQEAAKDLLKQVEQGQHPQ